MTTDLRLAWRMFLRGRGSSLVTVTMLAVAIAGALTLFAVLSALTTMWPDIPRRAQVARIYAANPQLGVQREALPLGSFSAWPSSLQSLETVAAFASEDLPIEGAHDAAVQSVTPGYFEVFQITPVAGRVFTPEDTGIRADVAVVGERLAGTLHGSASASIGKTVTVGGDAFTIVGVMPRAFFFPTESAQVWIPLEPSSQAARRVTVIGRLRAGKHWPEAASELAMIGARGGESAASMGWTVAPIPLDEDQSLRARNGVIGLLGPALIVLLIACVNTTNLMLSRGMEREGEFRIRQAMGASRGRLARQLLVEGALVTMMATAVGAVLSVWGIGVFRAVVAGFNPASADRIAFTSGTLLTVAAVALFVPVIVSIWPALIASRPRPASEMTGVTGSRRRASGYGPRDLLVFAEVALASVLVVTALMVVRLYAELRAIHPSFDPTVVAMTDLGADLTPANMVALMDEARSTPGVTSVATIKGPMFSLQNSATSFVQMDGSPQAVPASVAEVSVDYFQTLGLPLVAGRSFQVGDEPADGVAVIGVPLAKKLSGESTVPHGTMTLRTRDRSYQLHVIGVAAEALAPNAFSAANVVYLPLSTAAGGPVRLVVRTAGSVAGMIERLSRRLSTAAGRRVVRVQPIAESIGRRDTELIQWLLVMFSALAVMLAAGGIFAVSRHAVLQRTREFGIRLALGATSGGLVRMVLRRDLALAGMAVALAASGTLLVTRYTFWEMLIVAVRSPTFWAATLVILGGVSVLACYVAARRVFSLQPIEALRDN